ncbi:HIT-like domain-containing protein [Dichotomocladium elegans]|nr:HIT-like domain-containing protein [Dichotomocladium elegans]
MASLEYVINHFKFSRVLSHDTRTKLVYVLGEVDGENAILSFEKAHYNDEDLSKLASQTKNLKDITENNIYGWGMGNVHLLEPDTRIKMIYPATELHIRKHEQQTRRMVLETPNMYTKVTLPYINSIPAARIQWVKNILDGTSEADRIIFRCNDFSTGFVILPDMKWDGTSDSLYWVAIAIRDDVRSLRDLTTEHLPLLKAIRDTAYAQANKDFGISNDQLRLFLHYQPSYYHLHVHITAISFADAPGLVAGQAHLLDTVIDNIELYNDYYKRATLPFVIGDTHPLFLAHNQQP